MEALHQDTFKRQAPARTSSDYDSGPNTSCTTCTYSALESHDFSHTHSTPNFNLASTPRTLSRQPSYATPELDTLSERIDHIENRASYKTTPSDSYDARNATPPVDDLQRTPSGHSAGFPRANLADSQDGPAFPATKAAPEEAGIWDVDPLTIVDSAGNQTRQKSIHKSSKTSSASASTDHPDLVSRFLGAIRSWPQQERAFSRTLGVFAFLLLLKTPTTRPTVARIGILGAATLAWPLEAFVLVRKGATKMGWETMGLQKWWRKELAKNNNELEANGRDGFVPVAGVPRVEIDDDGMEEEVVDPEVYGTAEEGVNRGSPEVKKGEAREINKAAKEREMEAKKARKNQIEQAQGCKPIKIAEVKDAIKSKVHSAAHKLSEAVQETKQHVAKDIASAEASAHSASSRSTHGKSSSLASLASTATSSTARSRNSGAHSKSSSISSVDEETAAAALEYVQKGFEVSGKRPQENATTLFGILSEEKEAGGGVEFRRETMPKVKENAAALFGILGNAKESEPVQKAIVKETKIEIKKEQGKKNKKANKKINKN